MWASKPLRRMLLKEKRMGGRSLGNPTAFFYAHGGTCWRGLHIRWGCGCGAQRGCQEDVAAET